MKTVCPPGLDMLIHSVAEARSHPETPYIIAEIYDEVLEHLREAKRLLESE
jgi:hypothetical protein